MPPCPAPLHRSPAGCCRSCLPTGCWCCWPQSSASGAGEGGGCDCCQIPACPTCAPMHPAAAVLTASCCSTRTVLCSHAGGAATPGSMCPQPTSTSHWPLASACEEEAPAVACPAAPRHAAPGTHGWQQALAPRRRHCCQPSPPLAALRKRALVSAQPPTRSPTNSSQRRSDSAGLVQPTLRCMHCTVA